MHSTFWKQITSTIFKTPQIKVKIQNSRLNSFRITLTSNSRSSSIRNEQTNDLMNKWMDEWVGRPLLTVNRFLLALTKLNRVMNLCRSKIYLLVITWMIKRCESRGYCGLFEGVMPYSLEETPSLRTDRQNKENHPNMPQFVERMPQAKYFVGRLTILGKYRTWSTGSSFYPVSEMQLS